MRRSRSAGAATSASARRPVAKASERRVASGWSEIGRGPGPRAAAAAGTSGCQTAAEPGAIRRCSGSGSGTSCTTARSQRPAKRPKGDRRGCSVPRRASHASAASATRERHERDRLRRERVDAAERPGRQDDEHDEGREGCPGAGGSRARRVVHQAPRIAWLREAGSRRGRVLPKFGRRIGWSLHLRVECALWGAKCDQDKNTSKTLGFRAAQLVAMLHERGRRVFTLADVTEITSLKPASARGFVRKLVQRGVATRLRPVSSSSSRSSSAASASTSATRTSSRASSPGATRLLPLARLGHGSPRHGHAAAARRLRRLRPRRFAAARSSGPSSASFDASRSTSSDRPSTGSTRPEQVVVSDLERTVIDGLKQPEYCGGFTEVAKGFWMRRTRHGRASSSSTTRCASTSAPSSAGSASCWRPTASRRRLTSSGCARGSPPTYHLLDPTLPAGGQAPRPLAAPR